MNYRTNFGNSQDLYNPLGYSNASKRYGNSVSPKNYRDDHGGGLGEVEFMLQNQRKKFREVKDHFQNDLDNQRKKRIEFENRLIKLKDEFSRKEVLLSESQFKINNLLHQNQDLASENDRLKNELVRLEELYGNKIHELEIQLSMETKSFQETTLQYNQEFTKFKKEGQEYVESLTFEMERKIKTLEEKLKNSELTKRDLAMQNKKLNDLLISNRLQFQQQLRDIKNKTRDQEIKKAQYLTKSYDQKLKSVEEGKQGLMRKIQEMLRVIQDKQSKLVQQQKEFQDELYKISQDRTDLQQQNNQLNYMLNKMRSQLADKDNLISHSSHNNDNQAKLLKQQLQGKKQQMNQLQTSNRQLRIALKDVESDAQRKRRDLAQRCYFLENEARKYKEQYTRLADILKSKINFTIDNVSNPRSK